MAMFRFIRQIGCFLAFALVFSALRSPAGVMNPLPPQKGAGAKTLLVYSGRYAPYSLADGLEALKLQLHRVATDFEATPIADVDTNQLMHADYVVVFCPQPFPKFSEEMLQVLAQRPDPVLWVGYGAELLQQIPQFEDKFKVAPFAAEEPAEMIFYRGRVWRETLGFWIPALIPEAERAGVIMSVPASDMNASGKPFSWKTGQFTFFTALPTQSGSCALFSDLLLDFYGISTNPPSAVSVFIEGYHCRQDHLEFRNLVKYLSEHGHPFMVGVIPAYYDAVKHRVLDLDSQAEFAAALRFAQQHGGRLVMEGYLHAYKGRTGYEPEFWDNASDRPLPEDSPEYVRERLEKGLNQMIAHGLFPLGWQTPDYAASRTDYAVIANFFSTAVERVQLSEATAKENFAGSACSVDDFGRLIIPENLGAMSELRNPTPLFQMQERADVLTALRANVALCSYPAYLTDDKLAQVVKMLEKTGAPFLDLAEGDHWVQTRDTLLLTGDATRTVSLNNARVQWQAFDRAGNRLAEEFEPTPVTGERTFKRRSKGDYEVYRFNQNNP